LAIHNSSTSLSAEFCTSHYLFSAIPYALTLSSRSQVAYQSHHALKQAGRRRYGLLKPGGGGVVPALVQHQLPHVALRIRYKFHLGRHAPQREQCRCGRVGGKLLLAPRVRTVMRKVGASSYTPT
jgi:hypothetical protein